MPTLKEKQQEAAFHLLNLILDCAKHEHETIHCLTNSYQALVPDERPSLSQALMDLRGISAGSCALNERCSSADESGPEGELPPVSAEPAPAPAAAPPAAAKKVAAKKAAAAPTLTPAPVKAPEPVVEDETPDVLGGGTPAVGITQEEADAIRNRIRAKYSSIAKIITQSGDPGNQKKAAYTEAFSKLVQSFGSENLTVTANDKLAALEAAVAGIPV